MKKINITAMRRTVGLIEVDGVDHDVRHVDGLAYHAFRNIESDADAIKAYWLVVENAVPTLAPEEVRKLSTDQLHAIVELAKGAVDQLEKDAPNGSGPTAEVSPSA